MQQLKVGQPAVSLILTSVGKLKLPVARPGAGPQAGKSRAPELELQVENGNHHDEVS